MSRKVNDESIDWAAAKCRELGVDDYSILLYLNDEGQARFGNNSLTITNRLLTKQLVIYIMKGKKRVFGELSTIERESVGRFVERLFKSMMAAGAESEFPRLPAGPYSYSYNGDYDRRIVDFDLSGSASRAIDAALAARAKSG